MAVAQTQPRKIYNPVIKDYATFLETSASTGGRRTLIEIELAPGGGNLAHYHRSFSERFEVLGGTLHVQLGREVRVLKPGESATAPVNTLHRFFNPTAEPARFWVDIQPGHTGFEQSLQIAYGLAADGKVNKQSLPTNPYHLALLFVLGEGRVPGVMGLITPVFRLLAAHARRRGVEQELIRAYCQ